MDNPDEKPLYTLTVSEFRSLTRKIVLDVLSEHATASANVKSSDEEVKEESHFTIRELTKFLRCSRMSIHNYKKLGLPFYRLGRKILFKKKEVMDFMRKCLGRDRFKADQTD